MVINWSLQDAKDATALSCSLRLLDIAATRK
eukprot:IDg1904t1